MRTVALLCLLGVTGCQPVGITGTTATSAPSSPSGPTIVVREVHDHGEGARVDVTVGNNTLYVDAISPTGIGGTRLELRSGVWPENGLVRLRYANDRPFSTIEGNGAVLEETGTKTDEPRTHLDTWRMAKGEFAICSIPKTKMKVLYVHWVDAYRR